MSLKQVGLTKKINKSLINQVQKQTYASILHREKQGKPKKTEYGHRRLNMTMKTNDSSYPRQNSKLILRKTTENETTKKL